MRVDVKPELLRWARAGAYHARCGSAEPCRSSVCDGDWPNCI